MIASVIARSETDDPRPLHWSFVGLQCAGARRRRQFRGTTCLDCFTFACNDDPLMHAKRYGNDRISSRFLRDGRSRARR